MNKNRYLLGIVLLLAGAMPMGYWKSFNVNKDTITSGLFELNYGSFYIKYFHTISK